MSVNKLLESGKALPLMEDFYTLQGEGFHTGKPAYFARIGGCDVGCRWCDVKESWNAKLWPLTPTDELVQRIDSCKARSVVITGGEPLIYPLDYLCDELKKLNIKTFLETSGSYPISGTWDWICLSPKKYKPPLNDVYTKAHELKVIIESRGDFEWAEKNATRVSKNCKLFLQPEWSKHNEIMEPIIDYAMNNPKWQVSIQSHKYMGIP